jgi:hypothetical protein
MEEEPLAEQPSLSSDAYDAAQFFAAGRHLAPLHSYGSEAPLGMAQTMGTLQTIPCVCLQGPRAPLRLFPRLCLTHCFSLPARRRLHLLQRLRLGLVWYP